ncbi:MAG: hypothetical protein DRQ99_16310 [Candidatus Parabeggiatoa sp. nov. 3]|nr:MAG: hypothetical protein DRQ99_16310 [Gammaproteobacteria bacterium]
MPRLLLLKYLKIYGSVLILLRCDWSAKFILLRFASLRLECKIYFARSYWSAKFILLEAIGVINNDFFWQCALSNKSGGLAGGGFPLQT